MTLFKKVYDAFFDKITDDMYLEFTKAETERDCQSILINALPAFEFPRFSLYNYTKCEVLSDVDDTSYFNDDLTIEEINILALLMKKEWLQRQVNSVELTRQKYYGSDFKLTSQANHLAKLIELGKYNNKELLHLQRLYKRRKTDEQGRIQSNWSDAVGKSALE